VPCPAGRSSNSSSNSKSSSSSKHESARCCTCPRRNCQHQFVECYLPAWLPCHHT
jgi:hypothetical protein